VDANPFGPMANPFAGLVSEVSKLICFAL